MMSKKDDGKLPPNSQVNGNLVTCIGSKSSMENLAPKFQGSKLIKLEKDIIPNTGPGRFLILDQPLALKDAVDKVKSHLGLTNLRLAKAVNASLGK